MKGECCHRKFHPMIPQCTNTEVYYRPEKLDNYTDKWTWCEEHGGVLDEIAEDQHDSHAEL